MWIVVDEEIRKQNEMKRFINSLVIFTFIFVSCKDSSKNPLLPTVAGAAYDLVIVGDPIEWKQTAGRYLFDMLDDDTPGLPQSEPLFNLSFVPESQFDNLLKPARNILMFTIDDKMFTTGKVAYERNRWAKIQAIVKISAPNQEEMIKTLSENKQQIIDYFVNVEYERSLMYYKRYSNGTTRKLIKDSVDVWVSVPDFLNKYKGGENFTCLSNGSLDSRQDIIVYRTDYHGPQDFTVPHLVSVRDSVLKKHIPGPSEGSYMATDTINYYPAFRDVPLKERYCCEMRGLWRVQGDIMGGPFVSRSYFDARNSQIVTVETFVYAPNHKKRNKIRLMEAIVTSVEFE